MVPHFFSINFFVIFIFHVLFHSYIITSTPPNSDASSEFVMSDFNTQQNPPDLCLDEGGKPKRCVPDFINVAFGKTVEASSSCGTPPSRHCRTTTDRDGRITRSCFICDSHPKRHHPPSYLTDLNNKNLTCWVSEPFHSQTAAGNITLKISFGKKYELTYISMQFCSTRPDSLAIYKSVDYARNWVPLQFYSSQCRKVYGRPARAVITKANEQEALCSDVYGNVEPLNRIVFSTLEGRPSAYDFDNSPVLQVIHFAYIVFFCPIFPPIPNKNEAI